MADGERGGPRDGWTRRSVLKAAGAGGALAATAGPLSTRPAAAQWSGGGDRSHGESLLGALKYGPDFPHFDYVNPAAPSGGRARLSFSALFDSFNPFNGRGRAAPGVMQFLYEPLMEPSLDEGSTHYGLVAEWTEIARDNSWVAFRLRDGARWHDGVEMTVADAVYSFETLTTLGAPFYRFYYGDVSEIVDEGDRIVRFKFSTTENKELAHILGQLEILPQHWWREHAFDELILEPPLGSGPYRIGDFEEGKFVEYDKVADYWGAALPARVGAHNFDKVRIDCFLDRDTAFEAFKKGDVDYWTENSAQRWAERFDFPAIRDGQVARRELELEGPKRIQGFAFNLRKPKFQDRRLREAFVSAFDFEWTNRAIYFDQYARASSYFQGSPTLMATGAPEGAELAILEPFRDQLRPELFTEPFELPVTDASGRNRGGLRRARRLLEEAGYAIVDNRLIGPDGEPVTLEFMIPQGGALDRPVAPFLQSLERLGVETTLRSVDTAQYVARQRSYDYDMIVDSVANSESPGNEQREFWGAAAAAAEGGRNAAGVANPVVDAIIQIIVTSKDRPTLEAASRALDRVLLWEHYFILNLYAPTTRIAFWDRFGAPDPLPPRSVGFPQVWWWDAEKAARI